MKSRLITAAALAVTTASLLTGCAGEPDGRPQLRVYAAASLTASFTELVEEFSDGHPAFEVLPVVFDGSSTLAAQLVEGAPANVFASADLDTMSIVEQAGLLHGSPAVFATNVLQIAVAPGNPHGISELSDLAAPTLKVVLCAPEVPCGAASRTLLSHAGVTLTPVSEEQNVTAAATKVRLGEADAGLVYATDIRAAGAELEGVGIANDDLAVNRYGIGVVGAGGGAASAFMDWVLSIEGQAILAAHGFGAP